MKKIKKSYKLIIIIGLIAILAFMIFLIYINLFKESGSDRFEEIENYKVSKEEISLVEEEINKSEKIKDTKVYTTSKIIKIYIELEEDVKFDEIKEMSNKIVENFDEKNLEYYDVEIFVEGPENSEIYPKIGYKHKSQEKFTWNR